MLIAQKIRLKPHNIQATYFYRTAGTARFTYNWALAEWGKPYQVGKLDNTLPKPSHLALRRALNAIKREEFPWMTKVTKSAAQEAIIQLGKAFQNFFALRAKYPQFRKKGQHDRFSISNEQFSVNALRIRIRRLGWGRIWLHFAGKIMPATVSRVADKCYASITVELPAYAPKTKAANQGAVGGDLGVSALAMLSPGEKIPDPKTLEASLPKLPRLSRGWSRKVKGSQHHSKARIKVARLPARISNIPQDGLHQLTTSLTERFHTIAIEGLNVQAMVKKDMVKNRQLARAIADMIFFEFRRQLDYKARWCGGQLVVADPWFASSQICAHGAHQLERLLLSPREWTCPKCSSRYHRDLNAASNLRNMALSSIVSVAGEYRALTRLARVE